jgi:hypothetical protein
MRIVTGEWLYRNNATNKARFILGKKSENMVACIGVNPSTAKPNVLDNTLRSVNRISKFNGFDGWIMYNIYPQRATNPNQLHSQINRALQLKNERIIIQSIQELGIETIWLAYGNIIETRDYLPDCMMRLFTQLKPLNLKWKIIGEPTQKGHPKHPLYKPTRSPFIDLDMEKYIIERLKPITF